jgi:protein arginine kinase activator
MICQVCKDKVASIRLKEIISGAVTELHLCRACYEAREEQGTGASVSAIDKALSSLAAQAKQKAGTETGSVNCPACGTSDDMLREKGRLGCSECYRVFAASLDPILSGVHGSTRHRGKLPRQAERNLDLKTELRQLQEDLQGAINSENYEMAARLRDKIRQFETI